MAADAAFFGGGATIATMTMSTTNAAAEVTVHHFHDLRGFHQAVLLPGERGDGPAASGGGGGGGGGGSCDIPVPRS